ncbi:MAG: hypothetical protein ACLFP2_06215 [Candidatus Woesearchaeota archaeon]
MDVICNKGKCVDTESQEYVIDEISEKTLSGQIKKDMLKKNLKI